MTAAVNCHRVSRAFGSTAAVRGLTIEVRPGELYGLIGPDGAGKTTTIRMVAGLMEPDAGCVSVLGKDPARSADVRESLGLLPQQYSLYGDLTVGENMRFFGQLFCLSRARFEARSERLLAITRLHPFIDRRAEALSGGMYKKLALACALLHQPRVLLLDEPTNGVDPVSRRELWALLYEFAGEGMAVLLSTPYMDEAARCHRVGLVHAGRLLAEGRPDELVRAFDHATLEIEGGDRSGVDRLVGETPDIVAASPAGVRLRVVVRPGAEAKVKARLAATGALCRPVAADFEDLFLAKVAERARSEEAAS